MGYNRDTQRTDFFQELDDDRRKRFFALKEKKFFPTIDNLYYGVTLTDDNRDNPKFERLLDDLREAKERVKLSPTREPYPFAHGLQMTITAMKMYTLCLSEPDMFDILFVNGAMMNEGTPRILIQLRAIGLWTRGIEELLRDSFNRASAVLADYGLTVDYVRENRIDYCYHTNAISSPGKLFREVRGQGGAPMVRDMHTNLSDLNLHGETENAEEGTYIHKDYIRLGSKLSNNVLARVYDKVKEVIELGYKGFFFEIWYRHGLINFYDKWCMEYALPYKSVDKLHEARLAFYTEFGGEESVKREFELTLSGKNPAHKEIKRLADSYMPGITSITNIEYQTMRKFYRPSDRFIDGFKVDDCAVSKDGKLLERERREDIPAPLKRLFKILDNRWVFLEYLTRESLSFYKPGKSDNGDKLYTPLWKRLRGAKLGVLKTDEKLLRDYAHEMDKLIVRKKSIGDVASLAVYNDNIESGFIEDVADLLSHFNDNDMYDISLGVKRNWWDIDKQEYRSEDVADFVHVGLLARYRTMKLHKDNRLKNRKKQKADKGFIKGVDSAVPEGGA